MFGIGLGGIGLAGSAKGGAYQPNPVKAGLWAEFAADSGKGLTVRTSGADRFASAWADVAGDGSIAWTQATEAAQPAIKRDPNGVQYLEFDGTDDILTGNAAVRDWLRNQSNATWVRFQRQRSIPSTVKRAGGFAVSDSANQRLVIDNTTGGVRRIQARRQSADAVTTLTTGFNIPTAITREAVRFRPGDGFVDFIADDQSVVSAALPTSGAVPDTASQGAALGGYAASGFCDVDYYYNALYRSALTTEQIAAIWNWADRRFRINDPF